MPIAWKGWVEGGMYNLKYQTIPTDDTPMTKCKYCHTPIWWLQDEETGKWQAMKPRNGRHFCGGRGKC